MIPFFKKNWKPLTLILLVAFLFWRMFSFGIAISDSSWRQKWLQRDIADSTATLHREVAERGEEQRRQQAADEERKLADEELAKVQANADAAQRAGDSLQQQLTKLRGQLARSETGRLSAVVAAGAAKAEAARVLAELFGESDRRAGIYAKEADRAYISGSSCERTYDKVTSNDVNQSSRARE